MRRSCRGWPNDILAVNHLNENPALQFPFMARAIRDRKLPKDVRFLYRVAMTNAMRTCSRLPCCPGFGHWGVRQVRITATLSEVRN